LAILQKYSMISDYHFGGYAKRTHGLISFMNSFYDEFSIPTDFVYTGKMMYGIFDLLKNDYFPKGSIVLCIHTGGLQGNLSLPAGTLNF
jgi:1-aminocyclopropane-1-carboxylate deaminase